MGKYIISALQLSFGKNRKHRRPATSGAHCIQRIAELEGQDLAPLVDKKDLRQADFPDS